MTDVFIATLGQRPEAITMALDKLLDRCAFAQIVILHTDPNLSGIAAAWQALRPVLERDYTIPVRGYMMRDSDGNPLIDLDEPFYAECYYRAVLEALVEYKRDAFRVHLLVAGGRKAMSIYATLAASLMFEANDQLYTVMAPQNLIKERNVFHAPPGMQQHVHLVELPILPNRLLPGVNTEALLEDPIAFLTRRRDLRLDFLTRLTPQERRVVDLLNAHPYATNAMLGNWLDKSEKTVENQLRSVYDKMAGFLDLGERITRKRQALLDLLAGKV
jgi:hypothetical protein